MQNLLFAVEPNALETLLIDAQTPKDVCRDPQIRDQLDLQNSGAAMHELLTAQPVGAVYPPLHHAITAEYSFPHVRSAHGPVCYNSAVVVADIHAALQQISTEQFRQRYHAHAESLGNSVPESGRSGSQSEAEIEQLSIMFLRLKAFYGHAHEHNSAVISMILTDFRG
ncbi:DUF1877 family protein [Acinetobacter sp. WZC-1]|uniref:DUF1877 family protein n=1 Tax=Acinetobacter sp. WZC-1 TaxID=3459034 RepID=UPI00403DE42D